MMISTLHKPNDPIGTFSVLKDFLIQQLLTREIELLDKLVKLKDRSIQMLTFLF